MNVAIIAAAGLGVRMGSKRAKQFLEIDGIPVIIHTLKVFEQCADIDEIVVVLPEQAVKRFPALARKYDLRKVTRYVAGGKTRAKSVKLGLESIQAKDNKIVAVHDGVRPFVTPHEISQKVSAAKRTGAAILVAPVTDTIKLVSGSGIVETIPRDKIRRALTPQCFRYELLRQAFASINWKRSGAEFTDESMLVEHKVRVAIVEGNPRNIKITRPEDIALAESILDTFR